MMEDKSEVVLDKKTINYLKNEMSCYFLRRKQIKNYMLKIQGIIRGSSIKEVEKNYPPVTFDSINADKKKKVK